MRRLVLCVGLACVDAEAVNRDWIATTGDRLPDDGFGFTCRPDPNTLVSRCVSMDGVAGWCDEGICRRDCDRASCEADQVAMPIPEDHCACIPKRCLWNWEPPTPGEPQNYVRCVPEDWERHD